mmetsp:Transcript_5758/g.8838  ORF Transcript_5758/g.8838 Transcript_5758/m.8838 type:complete len:90 (-) Transcript_5758:32-301(-)
MSFGCRSQGTCKFKDTANEQGCLDDTSGGSANSVSPPPRRLDRLHRRGSFPSGIAVLSTEIQKRTSVLSSLFGTVFYSDSFNGSVILRK